MIHYRASRFRHARFRPQDSAVVPRMLRKKDDAAEMIPPEQALGMASVPSTAILYLTPTKRDDGTVARADSVFDPTE